MATGGNGSDEIVNHKCCICDKKNITREADKYCIECQDYYCTPCTDLHKMFPSTIGEHQFIDKSNFRTDGSQPKLPSCPVERCTIHNTKLLDMYCADHDEIACATCVALNHRKCQNIHSISDEVDNLYGKSAADETKGQLLITKGKIEGLKNAKEHLLNELDKCKDKEAESIKQFRKEMEAVLDTPESESVGKLEEEYRKIRSDLEHDIEVAEKCIDVLNKLTEKLNKSLGNKAQEFVSVKLAKKNILETKESEKVLTKAVEIVFSASSKMKAFLNELKTYELYHASALKNSNTSMYEAKSMKQVNIKQGKDVHTCNVHGSCFTEEGFLLLADYSNKTLKRVDISSESVKDYLDLEASPHAVCQSIKDEVAVNLNNQKIQFVSLGNKMAITKQLKLGHVCRGLAYSDGKLFVSDGQNALYMYDMNGSMLHKITADSLGNALFSNNRHISINEDRIYIADLDKGLINLDLQGNYESIFIDPSIVQPCGVCTDNRGNIFLCGRGQSSLVKINGRTNKRLGVIGKVTDSRTICFHPDQFKLVVTFIDSNSINIYELE